MRVPKLQARRWDWVLMLCVILLFAMGSLAIYSATHHPDSARHGYFWRHLVGAGIAAAAFVVFLLIPLRLVEDWAWLFYGLALLLLVAVLFIGVEEYGARRWFRLGFFRFQPSEMAKLATIIVLARFLAVKRVDLSRLRTLAYALALAVVPFALVLREPDLGTAGAYIGLALPMFIWGGIPRLVLFLMVSPLITIALNHHLFAWIIFVLGAALVFWRLRIAWGVVAIFLLAHSSLMLGAPRVIAGLEPYQQERIKTFLNPEADPSGAGYQVLQSKIAIGSGRVVGKGFLQGTQSGLAFLPQQHTDFIFSVVGEEWGFLGSTVVIALFAVLIGRAVLLARNGRSRFAGYLAVGIGGLVFYHAALNVAMTMGLFPVTGLPLPFMSYGGSFLITMMAAMGLLQNVAVHRFDY